MVNLKNQAYNRNFGFWNELEQELIFNACVAIAGVGGDGFLLGLNLVRMGVQNLNIADPEVFEIENSNRVPGALLRNYGRNKAEVFKEMALEINPLANIRIFKEGVTESNIDEFLKSANLLIDETELRYFHIGVMLARAARKLMIPNMTVLNIGFAGIATSFDPRISRRHVTLERILGVGEHATLEEIKKKEIKLESFLPYIPSYGDIEVLKAVNEGAPFPSIVQGVNIAAAIGTTQAFLHIVRSCDNNRLEPIWAPHFIYSDCYSNCSGVIKSPKFSYYIGVIILACRSAFKMNPKASYSKFQRDGRG